jgi:hypothetical protein
VSTSHGSVLWPLTALFLHSAISCGFSWNASLLRNLQFTFCIFHFKFQFFFWIFLPTTSQFNITSDFARFENGRRHPTDFNFLNAAQKMRPNEAHGNQGHDPLPLRLSACTLSARSYFSRSINNFTMGWFGAGYPNKHQWIPDRK